MLFQHRIRQQVQRSQQSRKSKKMLLYQYLRGYSCRKYSTFTGGRTEGQKRFILWLWDCLRWFYLGKIREKQENRNGSERTRSAGGERGGRHPGGTFNWEGACYFRYCLDVVCLYTDLKNESWRNEDQKKAYRIFRFLEGKILPPWILSIQKPKGALKWTPLIPSSCITKTASPKTAPSKSEHLIV